MFVTQRLWWSLALIFRRACRLDYVRTPPLDAAAQGKTCGLFRRLRPAAVRAISALLCILVIVGIFIYIDSFFRLMPAHYHSWEMFDDSIIVNLALGMLHRYADLAPGSPRLVFDGLRFPLLYYYHGAWSVYMALPFVRLDPSTESLRRATEIYCAAALAANFFMVRRIIGSASAGIVSTILIASNWRFINYSNGGYTYVAYSILFTATAQFFVCRWLVTKSRRSLFCAALTLGFGLALQDRFGFVVAAFIMVGLVNSRQLFHRVWAGDVRLFAADMGTSIMCFGLGAICFILTALKDAWSPDASIFAFARFVSFLAAAPASIAANFFARMRTFLDLSGGSIFSIALIGAGVLWLLLSGESSDQPNRPPILNRFVAGLPIFYAMTSSAGFAGDVRTDHIIDFLPIASWTITFALFDLIGRVEARARTIATALILISALTLPFFFRPKSSYLFGENNSAVLDAMFDRFSRQNIRQVYVDDWQMSNTLALHFLMRISPRTELGERPPTRGSWFLFKRPIKSDPLYKKLIERFEFKNNGAATTSGAFTEFDRFDFPNCSLVLCRLETNTRRRPNPGGS